MFASALGWIGTAGTLGAYFMLSRGRVSVTSVRYSLVNVVGSLLAAFASATFGAWPSVAANLLWAVISGRTLIMALRRPGTLLALPRKRPELVFPVREAARRSVHLRIPA